MVNSKDFAKRLEKILEYYSLSATAFAEEIDFNRSTISHLLSGRNKPSLEFIMKVLQKFPEVIMDWLLFGKGSFPSSTKSEGIISNNQSPILEKTLDLFSEQNNVSQKMPLQKNSAAKKIDKIVIFYSDGSFNSYEN
jgi:transcriptional regulator with XRE-family HTH domain